MKFFDASRLLRSSAWSCTHRSASSPLLLPVVAKNGSFRPSAAHLRHCLLSAASSTHRLLHACKIWAASLRSDSSGMSEAMFSSHSRCSSAAVSVKQARRSREVACSSPCSARRSWTARRFTWASALFIANVRVISVGMMMTAHGQCLPIGTQQASRRRSHHTAMVRPLGFDRGLRARRRYRPHPRYDTHPPQHGRRRGHDCHGREKPNQLRMFHDLEAVILARFGIFADRKRCHRRPYLLQTSNEKKLAARKFGRIFMGFIAKEACRHRSQAFSSYTKAPSKSKWESDVLYKTATIMAALRHATARVP